MAAALVHGFLNDIGIGYCGRYGDRAYIWSDQSFVSGENALNKLLAGRRHAHEHRQMMLRFKPDLAADATILCLGAHCDDIEIGCGGTLVELHKRHRALRFHWVVFSGGGSEREHETRKAAASLMGGADLTLEVRDFRASYFPDSASAIKDAFEELRLRVSPDLIMTHYLADRHQDHRVLAELAWNTFRSHTVLEYEIPKYEGDLAHPALFCPLSPEAVDRKVATLLDCFPSQRSHQWFDADLFRGHMRLRGVECNSPTRYAEAFHARKLVF